MCHANIFQKIWTSQLTDVRRFVLTRYNNKQCERLSISYFEYVAAPARGRGRMNMEFNLVIPAERMPNFSSTLKRQTVLQPCVFRHLQFKSHTPQPQFSKVCFQSVFCTCSVCNQKCRWKPNKSLLFEINGSSPISKKCKWLSVQANSERS